MARTCQIRAKPILDEGTLADMWYHDEATWEPLRDLVASGEEQALERFTQMSAERGAGVFT